MKGIITSLLENDLYKFTMQQLILHQYADVWVRYAFYNRGKTKFPKGFGSLLQQEINGLGNLDFKTDEIAFLRRRCPFLKPSYLNWLKTFTPNPKQVDIRQRGTNLDITIEGPWFQTIYWEVPLMATLSELYFRETGQQPDNLWEKRIHQKSELLKKNGIRYADFGLRRRFAGYVQDRVVEILQFSSTFVGTSNVFLAHKYELTPIGTMAHELPMVLAALHGYEQANTKVLQAWVGEFNGDLGIALPDTFTTEVFLKSFTLEYAYTFDGTRQDSGSPERFVDLLVAHYQELGIDPLTKTIVFSDGLTPQKAVEIARYCRGKIRCSFGIGTNLTNDVGVKPLNIVIKTCAVQNPQGVWVPAIKLSDTPGKVTGDKKVARKVQKLLGI